MINIRDNSEITEKLNKIKETIERRNKAQKALEELLTGKLHIVRDPNTGIYTLKGASSDQANYVFGIDPYKTK